MARKLSLDILLGVYCSFMFASRLFESRIPALVPLILLISVWLVYTIDHLADAWHLGNNSVKPSYKWHWKYRRVLIIMLIILGIAGFLISLVLFSAELIYVGLAAMGIMTLYILSQALPMFRKRYLFKEFWVGSFYTMGVWGFPLMFGGLEPDLSLILLMISFFGLVMVNVLGYSWFEYPSDRKEDLKTMAVTMGPDICRKLILMILILASNLNLVNLFLSVHDKLRLTSSLILLVMACILGLLYLFPDYFRKNERFGILSDAVFILPGLLILVK